MTGSRARIVTVIARLLGPVLLTGGLALRLLRGRLAGPPALSWQPSARLSAVGLLLCRVGSSHRDRHEPAARPIEHTVAVATARIGILAPMDVELRPLVRGLELTAADGVHRGQAGGLEVVALLTTIGMDAARRAAREMLTHDVDHVMVVGIAGSVDPSLRLGDVVAPEVVVDRATGTEYRPSRHGAAPRGVLSCGDDLITDRTLLATMAAAGVVALDMETAAVAAVCDDAGCSWSVFRAISDVAGEGPIDDELFALTRPDGSADPDAVTRYFEEHPERRDALVQLARDTDVATEAAAAAAILACASLGLAGGER